MFVVKEIQFWVSRTIQIMFRNNNNKVFEIILSPRKFVFFHIKLEIWSLCNQNFSYKIRNMWQRWGKQLLRPYGLKKIKMGKKC